MKTTYTRRQFLETSARLAGGLAAAGLCRTSLAAATTAPAPALVVACRDVHLKQTGEKDCWAALTAIGAEGVELSTDASLAMPGLFHPTEKYSAATDDGIKKLLDDSKAAGMKITAFLMGNRFEDRPDEEVAACTKVAQAAKALGAKAVRIDLAAHKLSQNDFLELAVKTLKQLIDGTEDTGVAFAVENHGGTTNRPEFLTPLFDRVGSKRLGLTLDTGNFYWFGHPLPKLYELYEKFAPCVKHTHCKSIAYPADQRDVQRKMGWEYGKYNCPIYDGDIDFARVVKILLAAGYSNDLCIEDESLSRFPAADRGKILAKEICHLKDCLAGKAPAKPA